jgi:hypothetical protein
MCHVNLKGLEILMLIEEKREIKIYPPLSLWFYDKKYSLPRFDFN